jgi:hypothetical protein
LTACTANDFTEVLKLAREIFDHSEGLEPPIIESVLIAFVSLELILAKEAEDEVIFSVKQFLQNAAANLQNFNYAKLEDQLEGELNISRSFNAFFGRLIAFCKCHPNAIPNELGPVVQKSLTIGVISCSGLLNEELMQIYCPSWNATPGADSAEFGPDLINLFGM